VIPEPSQASLQDLVLDRNAEVPLGVQLAWALRARIGDGRFAPAQRLPGLRDLAEALHINANTVRSVYQRLEHEGVIVSRQGSGTFVADAPSHTPSAVDAIAANAAREAHDTGVDPRAVAAALYVAPAGTGHAADAEASRRQELRVQIAALQRTLGELEARHPALVPQPPATRPASARPRLLDVTELEQVQAQVVSRIAALHAAVEGLASIDQSEDGPRHRPAVPLRAKPRSKSKAKPKTRPAPAGA
jgi:DNA-binding transcriptional regulator YhcF (GntR family)